MFVSELLRKRIMQYVIWEWFPLRGVSEVPPPPSGGVTF